MNASAKGVLVHRLGSSRNSTTHRTRRLNDDSGCSCNINICVVFSNALGPGNTGLVSELVPSFLQKKAAK